AKNEKEKLPIASMTKMMSLSVIFDAIKEGKLSLEEKITISENAAETEGSQAFLDAGASYSVCDLIKSFIIASANDSTVALSERVAGSERLFANLMNEKAKQLNLTSSYFKNSTGLPEDGHYSSAKDCAEIYKTILNNEVYKKYANIWMDKIVHPSGRETELVNTNRLVKTYAGCSSGKTGYTSEAKYCLTTSATRNGTTLIAVVIGEKDSKTRFNEVREMLDFGFSNYESKLFLNSSEIKKEISVSGAKKSSIIAKLEKDYYVFSKINE
ncbi:MAG: D-alanyl-D-alanine carboxypeptidase, partial [Clostridia bacterium]|nr:D-alanyl-D-alanine carboxypeptidase [Clostridia bacterium]